MSDNEYEDASSHSENEEENEVDETIANPDVTEKYKFAAAFATKALRTVVASLCIGAKVHELCALGDRILLEETSKVYTKPTGQDKKKLDKGIAFPTCVSVNAVVCHYSPGEEETEGCVPLAAGDVVRVDLGCQIDGHCAVVADTHVVAPTGGVVSGRVADVVAAAHTALEVATHALRPGNTVYEITALVEKVATEYGVSVVDGVLSHRMSRYIIDGTRTIANKDTPEGKVGDVPVEPHEVWALDVVLSTGTGKLRPRDQRTLVYKRALEGNYQLKLQAAREVHNEVEKHFQTFPFATRHLNQKRGRIGIQECLKHDMVVPYPVLYERDGEVVAHVKSTVLVLSTRIEPVTGPVFNVNTCQTSRCVNDPTVLAWKQRSLQLKKKSKGKKKKNMN